MDAMKLLTARVFALVCLAAPLAAGGCSTLGSQATNSVANDVGQAAADAASTATPAESKFAVEFHYAEGKRNPQTLERPLTGTLHVQEALEQTGALKKFRRCTVGIVRRLPNGMGHKIHVDYDFATKRVSPEFDYALLPGDRLMVTEDTTTLFDDMFQNSWLAPLGNLTPNKGRTKSGGHFRLEG